MMFHRPAHVVSGILRTISRTSVIFVHDYLALSILIVLAGHITFAYRDPEARRGMRTGLVSRSWAKWEHPRWRYEDWPAAGIVTADLGNKGEPHMAGDDDISG
jgi:formate dehydrogenase subunit gamma